MFVESKQCRRNPKLLFFNDKELPKGSISERFVNPVLDCFDNPKGNSAYKLFSIMSKENKFVTTTSMVEVTSAQQKLLQLITLTEAEDFANSLKAIHFLGTYCVSNEMADLPSSHYTHILLDAIQEIAQENFIKNLKKS